jgi:protein SCO1/2
MLRSRVMYFSVFLAVLALLVPAGGGVRAETGEKYTRTYNDYTVPDVTLLDQHGKKVKLVELLNSRKVVLLDFIFTTCTTICPVLTAGFSNFQKRIGPDAKNVLLVSISIDPENDTPKRLREYLKRYHAKPGWEFLTGSKRDIEEVTKAFDAYTSNKMSHLPLALLHSSADKRWLRIRGLIGTSDLMAEYEKISK